MDKSDFAAEWGLSPRLEGLGHEHFRLSNHFNMDLDVSDRKVLEYIGSIEDALQDYNFEMDGSVQVYDSDATTERSFDDIFRDETSDWTPQQTHGGGMPRKGEAYFDMLEATIEASNAIQFYDGEEVDEEFDIYGIDFESTADLVEQVSDSCRHILGASVKYETDSGTVEFSFHSPNIHFEDFDFDKDRRRRNKFERLRNQYPFGIDVHGDEELRETVSDASNDFADKWRGQVKNKIYNFLS